MKTDIIVNPRSGKGAAAWPAVERWARAHAARIHATGHRGHARELAAELASSGAELVVAVGGDGTMNEVASGLVGTRTVFGLISRGSGNGLGRHLGTHGALDRSLALLVNGRVAEIDTGYAAGFPFFNLAGLGFEALLAERFNRLTRRGLPRYALATLRTWSQRHPIDFQIAWDGGHRSVSSVSLTVANGSQYGNNFRIAPRAQLDDGMLDLVAIPELGHIRSMSMLWALLRGSIDRHPDVTRIRASRFEVTASEQGLLHVDGETHQAPQPVSFTIRPASLKILVPAN